MYIEQVRKGADVEDAAAPTVHRVAHGCMGHTCTVTTDEMYSIVGDFKIVRVRISVSLLYLQVHHQPAQEDDAWATSRTAQKQPSGRERRK
jgi:hypothetical protein